MIAIWRERTARSEFSCAPETLGFINTCFATAFTLILYSWSSEHTHSYTLNSFLISLSADLEQCGKYGGKLDCFSLLLVFTLQNPFELGSIVWFAYFTALTEHHKNHSLYLWLVHIHIFLLKWFPVADDDDDQWMRFPQLWFWNVHIVAITAAAAAFIPHSNPSIQ